MFPHIVSSSDPAEGSIRNSGNPQSADTKTAYTNQIQTLETPSDQESTSTIGNQGSMLEQTTSQIPHTNLTELAILEGVATRGGGPLEESTNDATKAASFGGFLSKIRFPVIRSRASTPNSRRSSGPNTFNNSSYASPNRFESHDIATMATTSPSKMLGLESHQEFGNPTHTDNNALFQAAVDDANNTPGLRNHDRGCEGSSAESSSVERIQRVDDNHLICPMGEHVDVILKKSGFQFSKDEIATMKALEGIYFYSRTNSFFNRDKNGICPKKKSSKASVPPFMPADHINYRYEILTQLGSGAFGTVFRCLDHKTRTTAAIKVMLQDSDMLEVPEVKAYEAIAKKKLTSEHRHKSRCLPLLDKFLFQRHLCMVFPVGGQNLYQYLLDRNFKGLSLEFVRRIAKQLLECLHYLRDLKILHADLKPENILIENPLSGKITVIDFGCACFLDSPDTPKVAYIQSRMFRAPEVMLQLDYGPGIDLWSVAAILIEARGGKTAFPGLDCLDMLQRFTEVIGPTPDHMIQQCSQANPELADFYFDGSMLRGMASHPPAKYAMSSTQPSDLPLSLLQGSFEGQETTPDALTAYELAASRQTNSFHSNSNMTSCTQTPPTANVSRAVSQSMGKTMSRTPSCKIFDENQQSHKFARITNNRKISDLFNGKAKDGAFTSFLEMLLRWDPEMRPAPLSALDHPWIKNGNALRHSYSREPSAKLESLFSSSFKI